MSLLTALTKAGDIQDAIRYIHKNGLGLMNRAGFDIAKLADDDYFDLEDAFLSLRQPTSDLHNQNLIFAFTPEGESRHKRLIDLLTKASKRGTKRLVLPMAEHNVVWDSGDGQLGLTRKTS